MVITQVPGHPPGSKFEENDPTMFPDVLACPEAGFKHFWGVIKVHNPINGSPIVPFGDCV